MLNPYVHPVTAEQTGRVRDDQRSFTARQQQDGMGSQALVDQQLLTARPFAFQDRDFPGNEASVGVCSICGGAVTIPIVWFSSVPPVPTCSACGATAKQPDRPVIPMEPRR